VNRHTSSAIEGMQEACESYITGLFKDTNLTATRTKRSTIKCAPRCVITISVVAASAQANAIRRSSCNTPARMSTAAPR
jgi:Core histone H2A/H2B/H3/H4